MNDILSKICEYLIIYPLVGIFKLLILFDNGWNYAKMYYYELFNIRYYKQREKFGIYVCRY